MSDIFLSYASEDRELSEVLKLETEAVPVSSNLVVTTGELNLELSGIRKVYFHLSRYGA